MIDLLDRRAFGQYEIDELLGSGGMGTVYRARHRLLRRVCALKILPPQLAMHGDFHERFLREAAVAASLNHPNIVTVHDFGEQDGVYYLVMDLVEGRSLRSILTTDGPIPLPRSLVLLDQLASALDYMHAGGVLYRDLKPTNLMIGDDDRLTLVDFGAARSLAAPRITSTGLMVGTPEYLAPELLTGEDGTERADQYTLGVVAYEMLTGLVPFSAPSFPRLLYRVAHEEPLSPRELDDAFPEPVSDVLLRQLAKDPAERFPTAGKFVTALRAAADGLPVPNRTTPTVARRTRAGSDRKPKSVWGRPGQRPTRRIQMRFEAPTTTVPLERRATERDPVALRPAAESPVHRLMTLFRSDLRAAALAVGGVSLLIAMLGFAIFRANPVAQAQPGGYTGPPVAPALTPWVTAAGDDSQGLAARTGWEVRQDSTSRLWFESGAYHIENLGQSELIVPLRLAERRTVDAVYEAEIRQISGPDDGYYGMRFLRSSDDGYYLLINSSGAAGLIARPTGSEFQDPRKTSEWLLGPYARPGGAGPSTRLRASANGGLVTLSINGYRVGEMSEAALGPLRDGTLAVWVGPKMHVAIISARILGG